jgi:hypothetical protein
MPKEPTSPQDEPVARAGAWRRDLAGVCSGHIMEVAEGGHVHSGASAGNTWSRSHGERRCFDPIGPAPPAL